MRVQLEDLSKVFKAHNEEGGGYQIHLNTTSLEDSSRIEGIQMSDLYFTNCGAIKNIVGEVFMTFKNDNVKPIFQKEDGMDVYPMTINNSIMIDLRKVEFIEEVEDVDDWFCYPSKRLFNLYMFPESNNMDGNRNIITIGLME